MIVDLNSVQLLTSADYCLLLKIPSWLEPLFFYSKQN